MIVAFVVLLVLGSVGAWIGMSYVGYSNTDIELRNLAKAAQKDNENVYDKVWKVIFTSFWEVESCHYVS